MSLGKVTRKAISIVLLAAMTTSSLSSQASTLPLVQEGVFDAITYTNGDTGNSQNTEAENSAPDAEAQSADSESVSNKEAEAGSNSDVAENSENTDSTPSNAASSNSSGKTEAGNSSNNYGDYDAATDESVTVEDENPLTSGNRVSSFITLDKQAIGFTKVGDVVSVTATLADDVKDKVVWRVADPERLRIRTTSEEGNASTADIEWIGENDADQTTTNFYACLESNPEEFFEGTAMLFSSQTSNDISEQDDTKELKTEFESPEVEEFLKEMYAEGLSQENSDYDLSKLFDDSTEKTYSSSANYEGEKEEKTPLEMFADEDFMDLLSMNELNIETTHDDDSEGMNLFDEEDNDHDHDQEEVQSEAQEPDESVTENQNTNKKSNRVSSYYNTTPDTTSQDSTFTLVSASEPTEETVTETVTEKVTETEVQNVSTETKVTETVTKEIVDTNTTYETVTKEVEKEVPKTVVDETEQVIETEVINEDGEMETVTEVISVPTTKTVYETVTETVEEQVPVNTEYTVKETTTTTTEKVETVTNANGEVVSSEVVSTDTKTSSNDYVTNTAPATGTTETVSTSTDNSTKTNVTEKEVTKTVTKTISKNGTVSVTALASTLDDNTVLVNDEENTDSVYTPEITSDDSTGKTTEEAAETEITSDETSSQSSKTDVKTAYAIVEEDDENEQGVNTKQQTNVSLKTINKKMTANYSLDDISTMSLTSSGSSVSSSSAGTFSLMSATSSAGSIYHKGISDIEPLGTIEMRLGIDDPGLGMRSIANILAAKGYSVSGSPDVFIEDPSLATIENVGGSTTVANTYIKPLAPGRTRVRIVTTQTGTKVYNLDIYGATYPDDNKTISFRLGIDNNNYMYRTVEDILTEKGVIEPGVEIASATITGSDVTKTVTGTATDPANIRLVPVSAGTTSKLDVTVTYDPSGTPYTRSFSYNLNVYDSFDTTNAPVAVPMIASNGDFTLALKSDGTVWGWGSTTYNTLANIKLSDDIQSSPRQIEIKKGGRLEAMSDIRHIAVGRSHALAVKTDGTVLSWGLNADGQVGNGSKVNISNPIVVKAADQISTSDPNIAAGFTYDNIRTLGEDMINSSKEYDPAGTIPDPVMYVAAGQFTSYAITAAGRVYAWGNNFYGQVGNGRYGGFSDNSTNGYTSDVLYAYDITKDNPLFSDIVKISSSAYHTMALKEDGTLYVWGSNKENLLDRTLPAYPASTEINFVIPAPQVYGSMGDFNGTIIDIVAGGTINVDGDNQEESKTQTNYQSGVITDNNNTTYTWGYNVEGPLGIENAEASVDTPTVINVERTTTPLKSVAIAAGGYNMGFVDTSGYVYITGRTVEGQSAYQAYDDATMSEFPIAAQNQDKTKFTDAVSLAIGYKHVIALKRDGNVWAWGDNEVGQNGDGKNAIHVNFIPVHVGATSENSIIMDHVKVVSVADESVVIAEYNDSAYMPDVITITDEQKVKIEDASVKKFYSAGFNLIEKDRKTEIQGTVTFGIDHPNIATLSQMTDASSIKWEDVTPVPDGDRGLVDVSATNSDGGVTYVGHLYVDVKSPNNFTTPQVVAGDDFVIALRSDGTVWSWGNNDYGQLGNGTYESLRGPSRVKGIAPNDYLINVFKVSAGGHFAMALTSENKVVTWGLNSNGQLGDGTTGNGLMSARRNYPTYVVNGELSDNGEGHLWGVKDMAADMLLLS